MQISLNWLNDYVPIRDLSPKQVADALTSIGLEVEAMTDASALQGAVVVGKVLEAQKHPNADSLRVCRVDVGKGEPLRIVCGAPNAREGIIVAVATVGAVLPGDFKIKASKIRGEPSEGMMCSERELGLSDNHAQIIEMASGTPIGSSVADLYQLNDTVLTLNVTPNRSDCFGYLGVARDLAAKLGRPLQTPAIPQSAFSQALKTESAARIVIEHEEDSARFCALLVQNVKPCPSPAWLQRRLTAAGMRPINLLVDVTNYVMLEYSQPVHAYDLRFVKEGTLALRRAKQGDRLTTLDGIERELVAGDLVICDGSGPIGIAGIMGGTSSEVKDDTHSVLIEVAHFNAVQVRKTSKRLALHTEASHRFERGIDVNALRDVAQRVATLIWSCGKELHETDSSLELPVVAGSLIEHYPKAIAPARIALRLERLRQLSGMTLIDAQEVTRLLENLQFKQLDSTDGRLLFEIPTWRLDIVREVDLIEEVIRLKGYEHVPAHLPMMEIAPTPEDPFIDFIDEAKQLLAQRGLHETISFPFLAAADLERCNLGPNHPLRHTVTLANPIVADVDRMQTSVVINLLNAVKANHRQGVKGVRLFECGRAYFAPSIIAGAPGYSFWGLATSHGRTHSARARAEVRALEHTMFAGVLDQPLTLRTWHGAERPVDFFDAKGLIQTWLTALGISNISFIRANADDLPYLHPGASATIMSGKLVLGYMGELHPRTARAFEFPLDAAPLVFEFHAETLLQACQSPMTIHADLEKFPPSTRDLAIVVEGKVQHADIEGALGSFRKRNLQHFHLFDVFTGGNLAEGQKSMAYALTFQSSKRTLNDQEVDKEFELLVQHLQQTVGATLRA